MLRENGFTILEAFDGEAALELLRKNKPSLIFLDIVLPGISGFDFRLAPRPAVAVRG